jgi:hypothetical protein
MTMEPAKWHWWHDAEENPPEDWVQAFDEATSDIGTAVRGLEAAIYIARTRKRTGKGPTFSELFRAVGPDPRNLEPLPRTISSVERNRVVGQFRMSIAHAWGRAGWIAWGKETHSLRVGPRFRGQVPVGGVLSVPDFLVG